MSWCAETYFRELNLGTVLSVFHQPWGDGIPVPPLEPGESISLRFSNGATGAKIDVAEIAAGEIVIEMPSGDKWRMVRTDPKSLPLPPPDSGGAPATYWTIKERVQEEARHN
jgi:hypothetical protein